MVKVSIIVPVYNVEKYLRQCLDSLIHQTLQEIEIICVNDSTTDNSLNILQEYANKDNRVKVITQPNQGAEIARNTGIKSAIGQYIGFVDSDDYISLNYFEKLYAASNNLDSDIIATSNVLVVENDKIYQKNVGFNSEQKLLSSIEEKGNIIIASGIIWNKIYRRNFLIKHNIINYPKDKQVAGADNYFNALAIMNANYITTISDATYYYVQYPTSTVNSIKSDKAFKVFDVYDAIERNILKLNTSFENKLKWQQIVKIRETRDFCIIGSRVANEIKAEFLKTAEKQIAHKYLIDNKNSANSNYILNKIFSVKNQGTHKVVTIFGLKLKFKNKRRELVQKIEELDGILRTSVKSMREVKSAVDNLMCLYSKSEENTQKNLSQILKYSRELNYRNVFVETISESEWLLKKNFAHINGAANYSFAFQLYNILNLVKPDTILEFGMGQTTLLTSQYANYFKKDLTIVDHVQEWINEFSKKIEIGNSIKIVQKDIINFELNDVTTDKYAPLDDIVQNKKFDLIIIDGPFGFDRVYPRTNILDLIPENLNEHFVIILDDIDRTGEQNTAKLIFEALSKNGIEYKKSYKHGLKSQLIISSTDYNFIHWY